MHYRILQSPLHIEDVFCKFVFMKSSQGNILPDQVVGSGGLWGGRLLVFNTLKSTNEWALGHLDFCRHGDVIWAIRQTTGRGRLSRSWWTPDDKGLTLSVVLTQLKQDEVILVLCQGAALSVRDALETYSVHGNLKWPNDVVVNGKKIAGILAETDFNQNSVVLGIGLNVNVDRENFETVSLDRFATSMLVEKGHPFNIYNVRTSLVSHLEKTIDLITLNGVSHVIDAWAKHDSLVGSSIEVRSTNSRKRGRYAGLDERGRLRLIDAGGHENVFWTGDVERIEAV